MPIEIIDTSHNSVLTQIEFGTQWPTEFCAVDIFAVPTQFFLVILCGITNSRHVFEAVATLFIYNREPPWLMTVALALYHLHWLCCPCYLPYSRKSSLSISPTMCYRYETDQLTSWLGPGTCLPNSILWPPWLMTVALALYHLHWLCCPCYLPYSRKSSLNISPTVCYFYETHQSRGGCICKR